MQTRVTIIIDNQARDGLVSEHGLSMWIEADGKRILFDTGQGPALESNARSLDIDVATADILVLSHGHYDHTGGIPYVAGRAPSLAVYCHPEATRPRYAIRDGEARSIGMPQKSQEALDGLPPGHVHWTREPAMLTETLGITGPVPRTNDYEDTGGPFYLDPEGAYPDLLEDDQALWIQTSRGLVVCMGCAHAGLVNTLRHIGKINGGNRVHAVIGGFHLLSAGRERLRQTVLALRELAPDLLVPCHCTGDAAVASLSDALGERVRPGVSGMTYRF